VPNPLENEFHEAMLDIYRKAKSEAKYNAQRFLQMVVDHGGIEAAKMLINSETVSEGYTALWERGRLDLTVEANGARNKKYHSFFSRRRAPGMCQTAEGLQLSCVIALARRTCQLRGQRTIFLWSRGGAAHLCYMDFR